MLYITHNRRNGAHRRGVSLVEVLVALVLLVVGIYSIARLFPGGFFSLRSAQNNDIADRLAQGQLEQLKQDNNFLLDAVYMYSDEAGFFSDSANVLPNAPGSYTPPGGTAADVSLADIDRARYISGETFTVPAPNTASGATNGFSVHVLNDGPVVVIPGTGALAEPVPLASTPSPTVASPLGVYGLPPVHSAPWAAKLGQAPQGYNNNVAGAAATGQYYDTGGNAVGNFDLPSDLLAAGGPIFAVDYTNQQIALPPQTYDQKFTLEVKVAYPASGTGATATPAETVTFYYPLLLPASNSGTAPYQGLWFDPQTALRDPNRPVVTDLSTTGLPAPSGWVPGSAVLTRTVKPDTDLAALQADADPYSYTVYSSDATLNAVNLGVLAFNPRLQGQAVSASYLTYDWHIIHENDDIPTYTPGMGANGSLSPIHLALDHLKRVGDVQDNQTLNPGLFRAVGNAATDDATTGYDIIVLDTDTGQSIGLTAPAAGATTGDVYDLDNSNGPTIPSNGNTEPDPGVFLVSYQNGYVTLPNSTDSTNLAASAWAAVPHQHVRIFYQGDYDWAVALQKNPSLYTLGSVGALQPGQYGISSAGGTYHLKFPVSNLGQTVEVDDVHYTDTSGNPQVAASPSAAIITDYADTNYVDVGALLPNADLTQPITVGAVRGISARSVVVWKERGQWKSRSVSTILNQ